MNDELIISRMNELEKLILQLRREVKESEKKSKDSLPNQKYYTLKEAVELKFGKNTPYSTISTNYCLMPCGNSHYEVIAGVRRWKSEYIFEWLEITDKDIISYLEKYHVPLTGRIGEKYLKKYKREESV
jgi:hypothetical protein